MRFDLIVRRTRIPPTAAVWLEMWGTCVGVDCVLLPLHGMGTSKTELSDGKARTLLLETSSSISHRVVHQLQATTAIKRRDRDGETRSRL